MTAGSFDKRAGEHKRTKDTAAATGDSLESFKELGPVVTAIFAEIAQLSADTEGVSRPAFSAKETETLRYLEAVALEYGLSVSRDGGQNYLFSLPEDEAAKQYILVGSHVDSVPHGGNYDGLAGVVAGLSCLIRARLDGRRFARPVKVIALRGEESHWFGPCYIGSKCLTGQLSKAELSSKHKKDGRTLDEHLAALGIDVATLRKGEPLMEVSSLLGYVELHIEQGPMLVEKGLPAAIVSGIRGNLRHKNIVCKGEAGHSGAVPRVYRHDPVMAFADLLSRLDESWLTIIQKGGDLVLTSGVVTTNPETHSLSRIPDQVGFSLDCRSQSTSVLDELRQLIDQEMMQIEADRKVKFLVDEEISTAPAKMSKTITTELKNGMARLGLEPFVMSSGGGHDAAVFANAGIPAAMVFVRNRNGSHNPDEAMAIEDFLVGSCIIYEYLMVS